MSKSSRYASFGNSVESPYFGWLLRNQPITTNQANSISLINMAQMGRLFLMGDNAQIARTVDGMCRIQTKSFPDHLVFPATHCKSYHPWRVCMEVRNCMSFARR
ncbi:hypothetical protein HZ326_27415 [Fusarium oxysporum f. sp. albedinis]|nr:hypothetical protein HZ326_27415 [Fusarium oxysporum f. sp. albedinis]